jgi:hypothetical protein
MGSRLLLLALAWCAAAAPHGSAEEGSDAAHASGERRQGRPICMPGRDLDRMAARERDATYRRGRLHLPEKSVTVRPSLARVSGRRQAWPGQGPSLDPFPSPETPPLAVAAGAPVGVSCCARRATWHVDVARRGRGLVACREEQLGAPPTWDRTQDGASMLRSLRSNGNASKAPMVTRSSIQGAGSISSELGEQAAPGEARTGRQIGGRNVYCDADRARTPGRPAKGAGLRCCAWP